VVGGGDLVLEARLDAGTQQVGAFRVQIRFDPSLLQVDPAGGAEQIIVLGDHALTLNTVNLDNAAGTLTVNGFDARGLAAGSDLHLFSVHFDAAEVDAEVQTAVALQVDILVDTAREDIGTPNGEEALVSIQAATDLRVALRPGLNLLPVTWQPSAATASCRALLGALGGAEVIDQLARLDPASGAWEHCDATGGSDFPIVAGAAYAVIASRALEVGLAVDPEPVAELALLPGLNARAHPSPAPGLGCHQWLAQLGADAATSIRRYDRERASFEACAFSEGADGGVVGVDFPVRSSEGYLISAPADRALGNDCDLFISDGCPPGTSCPSPGGQCLDAGACAQGACPD
jgi:hypothetical protein